MREAFEAEVLQARQAGEGRGDCQAGLLQSRKETEGTGRYSVGTSVLRYYGKEGRGGWLTRSARDVDDLRGNGGGTEGREKRTWKTESVRSQ